MREPPTEPGAPGPASSREPAAQADPARDDARRDDASRDEERGDGKAQADAIQALAGFDRLLDMDPSARERELRRLAEDSPGAHAILARMLAANASPSWLDRPAAEPGAAAPHADPLVGARLGPWSIQALIGEGGMGRVYRADRDDGQYRQTVALKRLRAELLSPGLREAFLREREILARLSHPNICQLIDGGLDEDGLPWLAMSWVQGENLIAWCDRHRLPARARVKLFLRVCAALRYAHRQMVLHRDLKPSNLMVDEDGNVKLLDFGVAALLDAGQGTGQPLAWSSEYTAPEILGGGDIGVAADLYSLGRVLQRLLTGATDTPGNAMVALLAPQPRQPLAALARRASPRRAAAHGAADGAALARAMDRELDAIVARCLAPDPAQRYESAAALQQDLERWLDGRPVDAREGGALYRAARFAHRHRSLLVLSLGLALAAVGGTALVLHQRHLAQREARSAQVLGEVLGDALDLSAWSGMAQAPLNSHELLARIETKLRQRLLPADPVTASRGLNALARSFVVAGDYRHALELAAEARRLAGEDARHRIAAETTLAALLNQQARYREAERVARAALAELASSGAGQSADALVVQAELARTRWGQGDQAGAMSLLQAALDRLDRHDGDHRITRAQLLTLRGYWRTQQFRIADAVRDLEGAIALADRLSPVAADDARRHLVRAYALSDRPKDALSTANALLANTERRYGAAHPETGRALTTQAAALVYNADLKGALAQAERARDLLRATVGGEHPDVAEALRFSAYARTGSGDAAGAIGQAREALRIHLKAHGPHHELTLKSKIMLASQLFYLGQYDNARQRAYFDESRGLFEQVLAESDRRGLPMPDSRLAYAFGLVVMKQPREAERQLLRANDEIVRHLGRQHSYLSQTQYSLGLLYLQLHRHDEARTQFEGLVADFRATREAPYVRRMTAFGALDALGDLDHEDGLEERAREHWRQALALGTQIYGAQDQTLWNVRKKLGPDTAPAARGTPH